MPFSQPDIAQPLLQYLQQAFENTSLQYHTPPTPLTGGYSSQLFTFQLETTGALAKPLVLRVFPANSFPQGQAFIEGEIQNILHAQGYPTAPVHSICEDPEILGDEFIIMQFMPGKWMKDVYPFDQVPFELAHAHTQLHRLDMDKINRTLRMKGFFTRQHVGRFSSSFTMMLDKTEALITTRQLNNLMPALTWMQRHRSIVGKKIVVNHCDFHPMNILIDQRTISAVLDWQGFRLGEPEADVANTMVKLHCIGSVLLPQYDWSALIKPYITEYHQLSPLNLEKLRYYQAVWCIRFFIIIIGGLPRVNHPLVRQRLLDHFQAITGIEIKER
jgi:aminoglycoside phosphotransferase (APT) family kinase protein